MLGDIDNKSLTLLGSGGLSGLLRDKRPQLVGVDDGGVLPVSLPLELSHAHLTEVTRMAVQEIQGQRD